MAKRKNANGMGSLITLPNGYKQQIYTVRDNKGKFVRISATGKTAKEARDKADRKLEKYNKEKMLDKNKITFGDLAAKTIETQLNTGEITENTYRRKMDSMLMKYSRISNVLQSQQSLQDLMQFVIIKQTTLNTGKTLTNFMELISSSMIK